MGRRAPDNPRYQRGAEVGKTRRSAASAKPKRGKSAASKQAAKTTRRGRMLAPVPTSPEYRRLRKVWGAALLGAIVFSLVAWWQQGTWFGTVVLVLAYACIFTAFYLDFMKLRPMRKAAIEAEKAAKDEKAGKSKKDRPEKAEKAEKESDT